MAGRIPQRVDLKLYAGDSETYGLSVLDVDSSLPIDTSAGQWDAQIKADGLPEAVEAFTVTVEPDRVVLTIDAGASQRLGDYRQALRWDLQQTFDDATVQTHAQGLLLVTSDVTRTDWVPPPDDPDDPDTPTPLLTEGTAALLTEGGVLLEVE